MLAILSDWYRRGSIHPIHPVKVFEAADIVSAFRYMQAGTHLGKIVVHMPANPDSLPRPIVKTFPSFRSDSAYLLVGGLGGERRGGRVGRQGGEEVSVCWRELQLDIWTGASGACEMRCAPLGQSLPSMVSHCVRLL